MGVLAGSRKEERVGRRTRVSISCSWQCLTPPVRMPQLPLFLQDRAPVRVVTRHARGVRGTSEGRLSLALP